MKKRKKPKDIKNLVIPKLREASRYWSEKRKARDSAKVKIVVGTYKNGNPIFATKYRCACCNDTFDYQDTAMDHIEPVVDPIVGFIDWNTYIARLFVTSDKYQCLCKICHENKTFLEKQLRKTKKKQLTS